MLASPPPLTPPSPLPSFSTSPFLFPSSACRRSSRSRCCRHFRYSSNPISRALTSGLKGLEILPPRDYPPVATCSTPTFPHRPPASPGSLRLALEPAENRPPKHPAPRTRTLSVVGSRMLASPGLITGFPSLASVHSAQLYPLTGTRCSLLAPEEGPRTASPVVHVGTPVRWGSGTGWAWQWSFG